MNRNTYNTSVLQSEFLHKNKILPENTASMTWCEQFDENQMTGNLKDGIIYPERVQAWKEFADYEKCFGCMLYPRCNRLVLCSSKDRCNYYLEMVTLINNTIIQLVNAFI